MLAVVVIFLSCAVLTGIFTILELNWSIKNFREGWHSYKGPFKVLAILKLPLYMMPILLDVGITLSITMFLGAEGMMGLMVSMTITSAIAGYLFYMRRKHGWKYF